jgi:hypothetical protein
VDAEDKCEHPNPRTKMLFWSSNSRGKKQYKNHEKESQKVEVVWEVKRGED